MHTHPPTHCKIAGLCTHFNLAFSGPCCKIFALIIMLCFRMFKPLTMNEQLVFPVQLHTSHSHFIRMPVKFFKHVFGLMYLCYAKTFSMQKNFFLKAYWVENTLVGGLWFEAGCVWWWQPFVLWFMPQQYSPRCCLLFFTASKSLYNKNKAKTKNKGHPRHVHS